MMYISKLHEFNFKDIFKKRSHNHPKSPTRPPPHHSSGSKLCQVQFNEMISMPVKDVKASGSQFVAKTNCLAKGSSIGSFLKTDFMN
jgi:hypothetical protein